MSHTFALLDVSPAAYAEIREKLKAAGYDHALHGDGVIDLHGLALTTEHETGCYAQPYPEGRGGPCSCRVIFGATPSLVVAEAAAALKATESAAVEVSAAQLERLSTFKKYVHDRLDQMNVPADPEPVASAAHGCRIEGRLNWLLDQMIEAEDKAETLEHRVAKLGVPPDLVLLKKRGLYYRTEMAGYADGILYAGTYPREVAEAHARGSSGEVTVVSLADALKDNVPRIDRFLLLTVLGLRGEL